MWFKTFTSVVHPTDADGMANSVDPDQTAPEEVFLPTRLEFVEPDWG